MKKTEGRKGKLEYRERTKVKITNRLARVKKQSEIMRQTGGQKRSIEWRAELIQQLIPIGLEAVKHLMEEEVAGLVGERYCRGGMGSRWGKNQGWVHLADQKVHVEVPRVRSKDGGRELGLASYRAMQECRQTDELALRRVILGLSQKNYKKAAIEVPQTFGIAKSSISRRFIKASARKLREFQERDLSEHDIVAIVMDGKTFARNQVVIALGVTLEGEKVLLGFVEASTENHRICREFLRGLIDRGLRVDNEILFVIDGAKGLRKGIEEVFEERGLVQRCQWHKRENVLQYLGKADQEMYRRKLQASYEQPSYSKAKARLLSIGRELERVNLSAARSLEEGLEETLTLHRLGMFTELGVSLKTTNMLENINSLLELSTGRVNYWQSSDHRQRWVATALLEIEQRLRPIKGCKYLPALRDAMKKQVQQKQSKHLQNVA